MSTSDGVQKRNAFAACAAFRIEGLEPSLDHAREFAVREELDAVNRRRASPSAMRSQMACPSSDGRHRSRAVGADLLQRPPTRSIIVICNRLSAMLFAAANRARRGSHKRPGPPGVGARRAETCHDAPSPDGRRDRLTNARLAA
jgi:hypothetical protein